VWQWHNGLPILFVAVAQWLAYLIVWQWHNGLPILFVAVALFVSYIKSRTAAPKKLHNKIIQSIHSFQ
jgi:hypothetical protein